MILKVFIYLQSVQIKQQENNVVGVLFLIFCTMCTLCLHNISGFLPI
ncbi:hypothetical protein WANA31_0332 [Wolbachia endosymbiont of Drosophila ananassae]|nr:hypothetical protein WANA31_0332 [Wolbachia endosymbiont of Drosophila ananassae]RLT60309.1 hypothetical protein WANA13_0592 [Wolbachia endosymbiont of Drosophila ananassae]RLT63320.1 hypothetical protein WANA34_0436 [Wolbachia endosymbiont of Drosophila ananassae]